MIDEMTKRGESMAIEDIRDLDEDGYLRGEEQLRLLIERAPTAIAISRHGLTIYGNQRYLEMFGFVNCDELFGRPFAEQIAPQERERVMDFSLRHDLGLPVETEIETIGLRKDGSEFPFHVVTARVDLPGGPAILGFFIDITGRKRAEEALYRSQQMLQLVLDNVPDRIFWKDRDLNYLGSNKNAALDAGLTDPSEIVGKNDHELAWRHSADSYRADDRQVISSGIPKINFEESQIQPDGSILWLKTNKVPLRDTDGKIIGVLGTYENITDRKRVENELRESEKRFRSLIEQAPIAIALNRGGRFVYANPRYLEMFGYDQLDELTGRPILDMFAPQDRERAKEGNRRLESGLPEADENEFTGLRKDGSQFPFHVAITKVDLADGPAIVAFLTDITRRVNDQRRIEELAAKAEEERIRLRTILDTLPVGVITYDAEGTLIEVNDISREIMRGHFSLSRSISENDYRGWWADSGIKLKPVDWAGAKAMIGGERIDGQVIDVERFDGTRGTILDSGAPLRDARGRIIGSVAVIQDITQQRKLEHDAIAAKERAELYIDLLIHDINNMNAAARGYLQLIEEKTDLDKKSRERLMKCQKVMNDISNLIENVKKIQRIEGLDTKRGMVDLGWIIEDVAQSYRDQPGKDVTINYRPQLKKMVLASELLFDVFSNLIGNAIKHSHGPVTIDIGMSKIFDSGREYYMVTVEDDGPGISDEAKKRIFSRLQRGKTRASGSGLGLYLVRRLVEDFQGRVWVEDRVVGDPSKGAKFVVILPVVVAPEDSLR